jgi:hypothetical protein
MPDDEFDMIITYSTRSQNTSCYVGRWDQEDGGGRGEGRRNYSTHCATVSRVLFTWERRRTGGYGCEERRERWPRGFAHDR